MNLNRPHPLAVFATLIVAASVLVWLASCASNTPVGKLFNDPTPAADVTPAADKTVDSTKGVIKPLGAATQRAARLTPGNVEREKSGLMKELAAAWGAAVQAVKDAAATAKVARESNTAATKLLEDVKERDEQIAKDQEEKRRLNEKIREIQNSHTRMILGLGILLCLGLSVYGGYTCFQRDFKNGVPMALAGAFGIAVCMMALTLQHFFFTYEREIGIGVCIVAGGGLVLGGYLAYRRLVEDTASGIKANQAAIVTGILPLAEAAPVLNAVQTKRYKKLVNLNTPKKPKAEQSTATHHPTPNLAAGSSWNVTTTPAASPATV